jgi:hypothetical protein
MAKIFKPEIAQCQISTRITKIVNQQQEEKEQTTEAS